MTSHHHNLIGDPAGTSNLLPVANGDKIGTFTSPIDPLLGPLQNNGGPTQTMALLPGSPALDAGNPDKSLIPVSTDQRGFARIGGTAVDIGAFERQKPAITGLTIPATGAEGSPVALSATATDLAGASDPLSYTWTVTRPDGTTLSTLTGASASFTPPDNGNYGVRLTVNDGDGGITSLPVVGLTNSWRGEGNALDSQSGNNGTLVGGVTFAAGKVGQAFSLDGVGAYVKLPDNVVPYPTSGTSTAPLSFETWFRTSTGGVIFGQQGTTGGYVPAVYVGTDGKLRAELFWKGAIDPVVSASPVNDGQFHHVAIVYDGALQTVFLDGAAIGTRAHTQVAYAGSYQYQLGAGLTASWPGGNGGWYAFQGLIDEAGFYNRALSAADVRSIVNAGSVGRSPAVAVANVAPTPTFSGYSTGLATQILTYTVAATDPSPVDTTAGFAYSINWGDSSPIQTVPRAAGNGSGVSISHVFTSAGTYSVTLSATDKENGTGSVSSTVTVLDVTSANLQTVINQQGSISFQDTTDAQAQSVLTAVNGLSAQSTPLTITMNLGSGSYTDTAANPPAGVTLVISGSAGTTIVGHSPALNVTGGNVVVSNLTLVTDTDSPTLIVSGGHLMLRNVVVQESSTASQAALMNMGGTVDLGTADSPGGNLFDVNGTGALIHNQGSAAVSMLGDAVRRDGVALTSSYRIEDLIYHWMDNESSGVVTWDPHNLFVTQQSGSIQRGIDGVTAGGTVNVEAGKYENYDAGSKLVTIAFENGPVLTQQADALNPSVRTLVVQGTLGNDKILFNPGGGTASTVKVMVNDVAPGTFSPNGRLIAYGGASDDDIQVAGGIRLAAWLYGGDGNDRLKGGGGNNVLLGGAGDDRLIGSGGRNLLIGGLGADTLNAGCGDDLLIGGTTAFDANEAALDAIMAEWTSGRNYATRVANLRGTGSGPRNNGNSFLKVSGPDATVFDDNAVDVLNGGTGMDWFFASLSQDILHGRHGSQIVESL